MLEHKPTDEQRRQVEAMAGYGVQQEVICNVLQISKPTLHKHYRLELDQGNAKALAQIAQSAFDKAVRDKDTTMIIWLTKTRLKWKDESKVILGGDPENPLELHVTARDVIASRLARLAPPEGEGEDP